MTEAVPIASLSRSPADVFRELVHDVAAGNWEHLPLLYAERTAVSHPLDPFRHPAMRTRDELRAHFAPPADAGTTEADLGLVAAAVVVHETADPEVVVGEVEYRGRVPGSGEPFALPCIFVLRVRAGEIVESRDYVDHIGHARVTGHLDELIAAVTSAAPSPT